MDKRRYIALALVFSRALGALRGQPARRASCRLFLPSEASDGWFGREGAASAGRGLVIKNKKGLACCGKFSELRLDKPDGKEYAYKHKKE